MSWPLLFWGPGTLGGAELLAMFGQFALWSLLAVGGAITTSSDMQRWFVGQHGWLTDAQFTSSVALAQAAPGPNLLFVAVIGWNVAGLAGVTVALLGSLLPSTTLALAATRWGGRNPDLLVLRAFKAGMAPLTIGMLAATCWVLAEPLRAHPATWVLVGASALCMARTRLSPLWLIGLGAVVGAFGGLG